MRVLTIYNKCLYLLFIGLVMSCESSYIEPYEYLTISKGTHYSTYKVQMLQSEELKFKAVFDETAIYTSSTKENQHDVNKLLGFSDCNSQHHQNSARFGWRWLDDQLEILAYCYVDGERIIESIGSISLFESHDFQLRMSDSEYVFKMDNLAPVRVGRNVRCRIGGYYMLFPYFGGDDSAPHDISLKLQIIY